MSTLGHQAGAAIATVAMSVPAVLVAGCGHSNAQPQPFGSFPHDIDNTSVFAAYRQTQTTRAQDVTFPTDARYVRVRIECRNDGGWVRVRVADRPGAMGCGPTVSGGSLDFRNTKNVTGKVQLDICAPRGSTWSVAVETRQTPFPPLAATG